MGMHLYTYDDPPAERDVSRAVRILSDSGVLAYPNDLNWAFGCDAASAKALDRIYMLKPTHPRELPFSLLCSSISMAAEYAVIDNASYRLLRKAWPGPFTVLLNATRQLPRQLKDKRRVVGIRIPTSNLLRTIVERFGQPIATTSVPTINLKLPQGAVAQPPKFGYEVFETYGHAIDLVLDLGGELPGLESTIVDLTSGHPTIVRPGAGDPSLFSLET
jgi:tRNA threonylcarbamoyl adenosine modification protein (Sua5/YciO/YrdC/YwlC family)